MALKPFLSHHGRRSVGLRVDLTDPDGIEKKNLKPIQRAMQ